MRPTYVGISGIGVPPTTAAQIVPGFIETRVNGPAAATNCCSGGWISGGGTLVPGASTTLQLTSLTDGTSNTMMASEQSDMLLIGPATSAVKESWHGGRYGFILGWRTTASPPNVGTSDNRTFQVTSIRYRINVKAWPGLTPGNGDCAGTGICENTGSNIPLNSTHSGGVNVLMGDGSVRFVSDNLDIATLGRLATRDDGQPVGEF
jgi:prepilin-type processing-associated H-X9-DG protein